jgi:F-type H+-transporting ATPase subunit alpha
MLKQPQYSPMPVEEQVVAIYSGVRGYLDRIPVSDVQRFQAELLRAVRAKSPEILNAIRTEKALSKETEDKLKALLDDFAKGFA